MKARTLLKKLTDYGLTVTAINDHKIRLFPIEKVNDKVIEFVRQFKSELLVALHQEHTERKNALGHRIQVLRVLIKKNS